MDLSECSKLDPERGTYGGAKVQVAEALEPLSNSTTTRLRADAGERSEYWPCCDEKTELPSEYARNMIDGLTHIIKLGGKT